jgi:dTDP-glucose pyrophosphorylase
MPVLSPDASLLEGLRVIDAGAVEMALVVEGGRLVGLLSDGDVRRALLKGSGLQDRVRQAMQVRFTSVPAAAGRAEVLDIMKARRFSVVPIVGPEGELLGLHTLHGLIGSVRRDTPAMILCGGLGTRLRPITETIPKPMIPVAGRPILERIVLHLISHGFQDIYLATHYLGEMIEAHFGDGAAFGCRIHYLREERPLGTGGALALLPEAVEGPILVMNGDLITQFDAGRMVDHHVERGNKATMGVQAYAHQVPFGVVEVEDGRIVAMREKPSLQYQVNAGIYVLDSDLRFGLKAGEPTTVPAILEGALGRGERVGAFAVDEDWADVGRHEELDRARGKA